MWLWPTLEIHMNEFSLIQQPFTYKIQHPSRLSRCIQQSLTVLLPSRDRFVGPIIGLITSSSTPMGSNPWRLDFWSWRFLGRFHSLSCHVQGHQKAFERWTSRILFKIELCTSVVLNCSSSQHHIVTPSRTTLVGDWKRIYTTVSNSQGNEVILVYFLWLLFYGGRIHDCDESIALWWFF